MTSRCSGSVACGRRSGRCGRSHASSRSAAGWSKSARARLSRPSIRPASPNERRRLRGVEHQIAVEPGQHPCGAVADLARRAIRRRVGTTRCSGMPGSAARACSSARDCRSMSSAGSLGCATLRVTSSPPIDVHAERVIALGLEPGQLARGDAPVLREQGDRLCGLDRCERLGESVEQRGHARMLASRAGGPGERRIRRGRVPTACRRHASRPQRTAEFSAGCVVTLDVSAPPPV